MSNNSLASLIKQRAEVDASVRSCQTELDNLHSEYIVRVEQVENTIEDLHATSTDLTDRILHAAFEEMPMRHPETEDTICKLAFRTPSALSESTDKKFMTVGYFSDLAEAINAHALYASDLGLQCHEAKIVDEVQKTIVYVFTRRAPDSGIFTNYRWFSYGLELPEEFEIDPTAPMTINMKARFESANAEIRASRVKWTPGNMEQQLDRADRDPVNVRVEYLADTTVPCLAEATPVASEDPVDSTDSGIAKC
jgi:hypothetical protein